MRSRIAALLLAGTILAGPAIAASTDEFREELKQLIDRAEQTKAADPAFLEDLRDIAGTGYSNFGKEPDVEALEQLIERAEQTKAADKSFLADLRELADTYDAQGYEGSTYAQDQEEDADDEDAAGRVLIEDDFADGDFTREPSWTVTAGQFRVEQDGLRSMVREQQASTDNTGQAIAGAILGAITGQATPRAYAAIHNGTDVPNAFEIDLSLRATGDGRFDFGPYQGNGEAGYRLSYTPGASPVVQLLKSGSNGTAVIDSYNGDLGQDVEFTWSRDEAGQMTVEANGETLFEVRDRSFTQNFQGFLMLNAGGDFTVESVTVSEG